VNASSDRWRRFLGEVVGPAGPELPGYLQAAVGYSLTGETREQCLFLLYGTGANGKSTFLEILMKLLGPLAATTSFDTFLVDRFAKNTHDLARLRFARLVTARETEGGRRLAEGIVKNVTGGDTISARHLYHEAFEYRPRFKLWLAVNHKPTIRGTDEGIWRRIRLVPFTTTIPVAQRNPRLIDELSQELEGILAWAVKGAFAYATAGLQSSKPVSEATQEYRSSQDGLADFIAECTEPDVTAAVTSKELYRVYRSWSEKEGIKPVSHKALGQELQERGFTQTRTTQARAWAGLALRPY
jgi:putative DNA primase/helicase